MLMQLYANRVCLIGGFLLSMAAAGCAVDRAMTPERAPNVQPKTFDSSTLGYSWTLPPAWEFIPTATDFKRRMPAEVTAARMSEKRRLEVWVIVYSRLSAIPGQWNTDTNDDNLEGRGIELLHSWRAEITGSRHVQMLGAEAVEVNGLLDTERISVRLLNHGRRRFEFRCFGAADGSSWPCESAFSSFAIAELPESPAESQTPRILHLRDARFGLAFDAPDDSWLAIGPSTAMNGAQVVWIWRNAGRQIDLQAADLSGLPTQPDVTLFVARVVKQFESAGATVTMKKAQLEGQLCHHLEVSRRDGYQQDMFMLHRGSINYGLLITQPTREPELIDKAKNGFRLTER